MAHIKNPLEWTADEIRLASGHVRTVTRSIAGSEEVPHVRSIAVADLKDVLRRGLNDFAACRTDVLFICLIYPIAGLVLARFAFRFAAAAVPAGLGVRPDRTGGRHRSLRNEP